MEKILQIIESTVEWFFTLPLVDRWTKKYPKTYHQFKERFSLKQFKGLPLTIFVIIFIYTLFLLFKVMQAYFMHDPLVLADMRIDNLLYAFRKETLLNFFYIITLFAEPIVVIFLSIILSILLWFYRQRIYIFTLWFALIGGEGLTFVAKFIFHRERPDIYLRAITENSFSFPSGHATTVVLFYGFITYLLIRSFKSFKVRVLTILLLILAIILIDFSRLYLGVHYLSDVIAGNLVGFSILILSIGITEWFISYKVKIIPDKIKLSEIGIILGVAIISVFTMYFFTNHFLVSKSKPVIIQKIKTENVLSLFDNKKLPRFTKTLTGAKQEPIDLIIISPKKCFVKSIVLSKWTLAEKPSLSSAVQLFKAGLLNEAYPTAPMTPSFYNAEPNDFGFEKQTSKKSARTRHHARFWKTNYKTPLGMLYLGTISLDVGIKWGITHTIAPDIDTQRDLFVSELKQTGIIAQNKLIPFVPPTLGRNFSGDQFFTNGRASFLVFSSCDK